jgi:hypothetical protein
MEYLKNIRFGRERASSTATYGSEFNAIKDIKEKRTRRDSKRKAEIKVGDQVKVKTARFGRHYAKGRPEYTKGKVVTIKGKKAKVRYEGGKELYDTYLSHLLIDADGDHAEEGNVVATICYEGKWCKKSQTFYTIMAALEVGSALKEVKRMKSLHGQKIFSKQW